MDPCTVYGEASYCSDAPPPVCLSGLRGAVFCVQEGGSHTPPGAGRARSEGVQQEPETGGAYAGGLSGATVSGSVHGVEFLCVPLSWLRTCWVPGAFWCSPF